MRPAARGAAARPAAPRASARGGATSGALAVQAEPWYGGPAQRRPSKPKLRVVADHKPARVGRLSGLVAGAVLVLVFVGLFGVIVLHVLLAQGQDDVQRLQERVVAEQERQQELSLDVERLQAPAQVVAEAKARGMVSPTTVIALKPARLDAPPATTIPVPTTAAPRPTTTSPTTTSPTTTSPTTSRPITAAAVSAATQTATPV